MIRRRILFFINSTLSVVIVTFSEAMAKDLYRLDGKFNLRKIFYSEFQIYFNH
jgi:hypothetical protein